MFTNWTLPEEASGIKDSELRGTELPTDKQSLFTEGLLRVADSVFSVFFSVFSEWQAPFFREGGGAFNVIVSGTSLGV